MKASLFKALAATVILSGFMPGLHASAQLYTPADAAAKEAAEKEAARQAEIRRLEEYDKPLQTDHLGNALIDGAVAGVAGAISGAGVVAEAATEVIQSTVQSVAEEKITDAAED